ncbi:MAG: serine/threonine-protein kinase [Kofleriaceae bacterium]
MACLDEQTVLAFVGGRISIASVDRLDEHLAGCRGCRDLVVAAARTTFAAGTPAAAAEPHEPPVVTAGIDRYQITGLVGTGGQALVYAAHDSVLDRAVALKILRDDRGAAILDEARLVARLAHPNIVAIHDAGATADGALYLAMEYVATGSLERWLERPRSPREILAACVAAGRGVAAAHDAGVIHRDIKPANVLIDEAGRARVTDFGLAIPAGADAPLAGTLAYMAPEQRTGTATAASDQYSFAKLTLEAFAGSPPRHVERALRRALELDPAKRWPSMHALLRELELDRRMLRREVGLAAGVLVVGFAAIAMLPSSREECALPELAHSWNDQAFATSKKPFAPAMREAVGHELARYADQWKLARMAACEATQSAAMLDRRNECLDERRIALAAVTETLSHADDAVIEHAVELVRGLPAITACSDLAWLGERVRPPLDPAVRAVTLEVAARIASSQAEQRAGKLREAAVTAGAATVLAETTDHAPTRARAHLALGKAHGTLGNGPSAERELLLATQHAQRGRDDLALAEAWIELVKIVGHGNARYDEALRYADFASATIDRLGESHELRGRLAYYRCAIFDLMARTADADAACALAITERGTAFGAESPEIADVLVLQTRLATKRQQFAAAKAFAARALAIRKSAFGSAHPSLTEILFADGQAALGDGRLDDAEADYREATTIASAALGDDSPVMGALYAERAALAHGRGKLAEALALIDRSTAIREATTSAVHADLVFNLVERGRILDDLERLPEAEAAYLRALQIAQHALGDNHPSVSAILQDLGRLHVKQGKKQLGREELERANAVAVASGAGAAIAAATTTLGEVLHLDQRPREAIPFYERALAAYEAMAGKDHPKLIPTLTNLGIAQLDIKQPKLAIANLDRAIAIEEKTTGAASPMLALPLTSLGDAKLLLADRAGARAAWQRALALPGLAPDDAKDLRGKLAKLR